MHAQHMLRPRLNALFAQATQAKVVYVVAGAGYGKTQAVRQYIGQQEGAIVRWLQLTESDNISTRFWENLTHVIATDNADLAVKLRELGFPETLSQFKQLAEAVEQMEYRSYKNFLVLDDFHLISSTEILTFVERCSNLTIPGLCLFILSRKEPEINNALLLSKGSVYQVAEDALRFTAEEVTALFQQYKIPISMQNVKRVLDATKGWALAIDMLPQILRKMPDNFTHALDTVMQNIFKLLSIEAWDSFPDSVQKTMVKLSLLSRLPTIPLHILSDDTDFLKNTPELTSFIWFDHFTRGLKIHPLYLEFLQKKEGILSHAAQQETYELAAQWCIEHDFYMDAMYYYAKSNQFAQMVQLLFSQPMKPARDTSEYFLDILNHLTLDEHTSKDPSVLILQHFFIPLLLVGVERYAEAQEKSFALIREWEQIDTPLSNGLLHATYSNLAYIDMHICTATHEYHAAAFLEKSIAYAKRAPATPAKVAEAFINADMRSFACLVGVGASREELDDFLKATKRTAELIAQTQHSVFAGYEDLLACEYAFFKNELDLARNYALSAIQKAREKKQHSIVALAEKYLLRIAAQNGDVALVKSVLKQLNAHLDNPCFWNRQLYHDLYTAAFYAQIGRLDLVPKWLIMDECEIKREVYIPTRELYFNALYHISAKRYGQALLMLCTSHPQRPEDRLLFGELRLILLRAVARLHTGDVSGAIADFETGYQLSFSGEFELFFIELGKELHPLVAAVQKQADSIIPKTWLKTIDRKASIYTKKITVIANAFQSEPNCNKVNIALSERERRILLDLYHGLSREEIAENQYLSINTVKKALQSIFIKLDAHNSVDAVRIALEKKLIE